MVGTNDARRQRILFLTHRLPFAPNRGDRLRAFHIADQLRQHFDLDIVSLVHDHEERAGLATMRERGIAVTGCEVPTWRNRVHALPRLTGSTPLTHMLLDSPGIGRVLTQLAAERPPDVVLAFCSSMARFAMAPPLDRFPLVVDMVDVDSLKWKALAERAHGPMRWIYARETRCLGSFEREIMKRAQRTLVVNEKEAEVLRREGLGHIDTVPNGVDVASLQRPTLIEARGDVVFCGVMNYAPNVQGVLWFAREVWPLVRHVLPSATFLIVGASPELEIQALDSAAHGIRVTGTVPDVRPYLWGSAVSVAPLQTARGVQNKVLEAVAAGLPVVITSSVAAGVPATILDACHIADDAATFAAQVVNTLRLSADERLRMVNRAHTSSLSWEQQLAPLRPILLEAMRS